MFHCILYLIFSICNTTFVGCSFIVYILPHWLIYLSTQNLIQRQRRIKMQNFNFSEKQSKLGSSWHLLPFLFFWLYFACRALECSLCPKFSIWASKTVLGLIPVPPQSKIPVCSLFHFLLDNLSHFFFFKTCEIYAVIDPVCSYSPLLDLYLLESEGAVGVLQPESKTGASLSRSISCKKNKEII